MLGLRLYNKRAFSLIEAAIVLGVIGLIIGGIWIAASAFFEAQRLNETINLVKLIATNTNQMYAGFPKPSVTTTIDQTIINAEMVPANLVKGNRIYSPWGKRVSVSIRATPTKLQIWFQDMPASICSKIAPRLFIGGDVAYSGVADLGLDIFYLPSGNLMPGQTMSSWNAKCSSYGSVITGWSWLEFKFPPTR